jgi:hypothetical protein
VAKRDSRRGRSRKRRGGRSSGASQGGTAVGEARPASAGQARPASAGQARRRERAAARGRGGAADGGFKDPLSVGERPRAPWHPLPLSEILIFVGAIATIVGFRQGAAGRTVLFVGLGAVALGTLEVTLREHLSGYRSHTIILALLPVLVFHSAVLLAVAAFTPVPRWLNAGLLLVDGALFVVLFKLLRARFLDARRERVFASGR